MQPSATPMVDSSSELADRHSSPKQRYVLRSVRIPYIRAASSADYEPFKRKAGCPSFQV